MLGYHEILNTSSLCHFKNVLQLTLMLGSLHYRRKKSPKKYWEHRNCQSTVTEPFERNHWLKKIRERNSSSKSLSSHLLKSSRFQLSLFWTRIWKLWKHAETHVSRKGLHRPWLHLLQCWIVFRFSFLAFASFCTYNYCTFSPGKN